MSVRTNLAEADHMEIEDGFIVGVYNYCDGRCQRCKLTSRCRVFVESAARDFGDPAAPDRDNATARKTPVAFDFSTWVREDEDDSSDDAFSPLADSGVLADLEPSAGVDPRVRHGTAAIRARFERARRAGGLGAREAVESIEHFSVFVPMKMMRTLGGASRSSARDTQSDANGSGKAALLGLEEMQRAWQFLIDSGHFTSGDAQPFLDEIARMLRNLHRVVPRARQFVRPGLDELDAVRKLDAADRGH
jgi:hypothetical protein